MGGPQGNFLGWVILRVAGVAALLHALYALANGAIRFPGGRGGTGGGWVYWSEDPGVFLVMLAIFVGVGITGIRVKPVGKPPA